LRRPDAGRAWPGGAPPLLGYWIARSHWGGVSPPRRHAPVEPRGNAGHRRVAARHFLDNPASGRVLAKLGFRSTGEIAPVPALRAMAWRRRWAMRWISIRPGIAIAIVASRPEQP
jgi:RimJ/RimL family protein N-acetyltransferase